MLTNHSKSTNSTKSKVLIFFLSKHWIQEKSTSYKNIIFQLVVNTKKMLNKINAISVIFILENKNKRLYINALMRGFCRDFSPVQ